MAAKQRAERCPRRSMPVLSVCILQVGEPVDLPLSEPTLSYVIIGLVVGVYAIGISKTFIDGADVANDFLLGLAKDNKEVLRG